MKHNNSQCEEGEHECCYCEHFDCLGGNSPCRECIDVNNSDCYFEPKEEDDANG